MKPSKVISCVNVDSVSNISDTVSDSVIRSWWDGCCVCILYCVESSDGVRWSVKVLIVNHHWQNNPFWPTAYLEDFARLYLVLFNFFLFHSNTFFTEQNCQPYVEAQPGEPGLVFMSSNDRMAQLYPQSLGSVFVAFYDLQVYGGSILTYLHMVE
jgi:hypothetical protein